ncbi:hypothetical protein AEGHOMDF_6123 [Methylobacterium soli]|nr:hypothetical protein AEGHOMDF_6123 [Methylobacterium soli]
MGIRAHPRKDGPVGIEPVGAPVEGKAGVVQAHVARQGREHLPDDVGGVGDDQVEGARKARAPIPADEGGPVADPVQGGVGPRRREGAVGPVEADAEGLRQLAQERHQEAAGSGSEIEDAQPPVPVADLREGRLHQGLGVRPRHEGLGGEPKRQAPEFPFAEDARDGFPGDAPPDRIGEALRPRLSDRRVAPQRQVDRPQAEAV